MNGSFILEDLVCFISRTRIGFPFRISCPMVFVVVFFYLFLYLYKVLVDDLAWNDRYDCSVVLLRARSLEALLAFGG